MRLAYLWVLYLSLSAGRGLGLLGSCVVICVAHRWLQRSLGQIGVRHGIDLEPTTGIWSLGWVVGLQQNCRWKWLFREEMSPQDWARIHRQVKMHLKQG